MDILKEGWNGLWVAYRRPTDWFSPIIILVLAGLCNVGWWNAACWSLIALFHGMGMFYGGRLTLLEEWQKEASRDEKWWL